MVQAFVSSVSSLPPSFDVELFFINSLHPMGWQIDKVVPDRLDILGGVVVIIYWPRG
jgi:hypothetical protein